MSTLIACLVVEKLQLLHKRGSTVWRCENCACFVNNGNIAVSLGNNSLLGQALDFRCFQAPFCHRYQRLHFLCSHGLSCFCLVLFIHLFTPRCLEIFNTLLLKREGLLHFRSFGRSEEQANSIGTNPPAKTLPTRHR